MVRGLAHASFGGSGARGGLLSLWVKVIAAPNDKYLYIHVGQEGGFRDLVRGFADTREPNHGTLLSYVEGVACLVACLHLVM